MSRDRRSMIVRRKMIIIKFAICFSYFMIGGLATTNILRLLKGSTLHVYSSKCFCANCHMKIGFFNQMPIVSYIACRGKCKNCKTPIPRGPLMLEISVFVGMSLISAIGKFSPLSVLIGFLYYEVIRIICIVKEGKREEAFLSQYILAVIAMIPYLALIEFMAVLLRSLN